MTAKTILHIISSGRYLGSITRQVSDKIVDKLKETFPMLKVNKRDLAMGLPFIGEQWIGANFTDLNQRRASQKDALKLSDSLVEELKNADKIVIASPVYIFGLKKWK